MAIELVRESSETPNITNKDDARMARYAYSGYTGYVKNHLSEVDYEISGSKFKLKGGVIVVDGWEVRIDEDSWELDLSTLSGTQYYTIYLSVNVAVETADILSVHAPGAYPTVNSGDDLTEYPYGKANVVLYEVKADSGISSEVTKIIKPIPYIKNEISDIQAEISDIQAEISDIDGSLEKTENTLSGITSGINSVPKADGVEHLYFHSALFTITVTRQNGSIVTDGKVVFPISYTDTSGEKKSPEWYALKFCYTPGVIHTYVTFTGGSVSTFGFTIEIQQESSSTSIKLHNVYDMDYILNITMVSTTVGTPIKLR